MVEEWERETSFKRDESGQVDVDLCRAVVFASMLLVRLPDSLASRRPLLACYTRNLRGGGGDQDDDSHACSTWRLLNFVHR